MPDIEMCDKCTSVFNAGAIQECPHPTVNIIFGEHICIYCCQKCKHHTKPGIGIGCELKDELRQQIKPQPKRKRKVKINDDTQISF